MEQAANYQGTAKQEKHSKLLARIEGLTARYKHCGFSNYLTNADNKRQFEICKNLKEGHSITLTGKTGTGKTHLAVAILKNFPMQELSSDEADKQKRFYETYLDRTEDPKEKEIIEKKLELHKYRPAKCLFLPVVEMFMQLNEASYCQGENGKLALLDRLTAYDCLCLDDLGAEKLTDASRQNIYAVIDRRYREMKPVVITSNFSIEDINAVEPRIASRLQEMGEILVFKGKDFRGKE